MISKCKENIQIYAEQKKNDRRQKVLVELKATERF